VNLNRNLFIYTSIVFATLTILINGRLKTYHQDKLNAELAYLKAQINPHFLFNTLNSIYSLAIEKSNHTPTAIVKLSSMMRYVISEAAGRFVPLEKEMIYINSYIELQKLRLDNTAIVNYSFTGNTENKEIAPLVVLPFIENAFKHGVNPEATSQIDIQFSVSEENLYMHVFNLKVPHINNPEHRTGFGLENSKKQLKLIYPNKHTLTIEDKEHSFSVTLKITLS
jgi:LytS/YehU family sensor histidine kinase